MQLGRRCAGGPVGTWEGDVTGVLWGAEEERRVDIIIFMYDNFK